MRKINYLVVHCTATHQNTTSVQSLQAGWKSQGWRSPGYHYVIMPGGAIKKLLDETQTSNGVKGYNANAINIAYVGGIDGQGVAIDNRTESQRAALCFLLETLRDRYPVATILGHRDLSPDRNKNGIVEKQEYVKMCPCFDAKIEYKSI